MDLVDDHVLDAAQALARLRSSAAGRATPGVVMRMSGGRRAWTPALLGRRVAGPRARREIVGSGSPSAGRREGDPGERRPEVPLDVVGQRLERRDVQDPDVPGPLAGRRRRRVADEPVEAPQERGEGLAAAGRGVDQRVVAGRDRRPAVGLGRRRRRERAPNQSRTAGLNAASGSAVDGRPGRRPAVRQKCGRPRDAEYRPSLRIRPDVRIGANRNGGPSRARRFRCPAPA